jgi:chromosome segregation ATPase
MPLRSSLARSFTPVSIPFCMQELNMMQQELEMLRAQLDDMTVAQDAASAHIEQLELQLHEALSQLGAKAGGQPWQSVDGTACVGGSDPTDERLHDNGEPGHVGVKASSDISDLPTAGSAENLSENTGAGLANSVGPELRTERGEKRTFGSPMRGNEAASMNDRAIAGEVRGQAGEETLVVLRGAQERVAAAESRLQVTEASLATLQEQLEDAHHELKTARERVAAAEHQGKTAVAMVATLQRGMEEARMHAEAQEALVRTLQEQAAASCPAQHDVDLAEKLCAAEAVNSEFESSAKELENEVAMVATLQRSMEEASMHEEAQEALVRTLQEQAAASHPGADAAAAREQQDVDLAEKLSAAESAKSELEARVKELEDEVERQQSLAQQSLAQAETLQTVEAVVDDLKGQVAKLEGELQLAEEQLCALHEGAKSFEQDRARHSEELRAAELGREEARNKSDAFRARITYLESQLHEAKAASEGTKSADKAFLDAQKQADAAEAQAADAEQRLRDFQQRAEASGATEAGLADARKEADAAKARVVELEEQVEVMKQEAVASVKKATADLQQALRNVQAQMQVCSATAGSVLCAEGT